MAIDIGDAVLHFLGDTTQLDQAFNQVATQAGEKMGLATKAIQGTSEAVEGMTKTMAVGQQGAVELGETTNLAGEKVKESMYEARGEIGLLGEAFGINLPRHVRSFVAELPGVGMALSAAFQATAVLFLLDALIQGAEKLAEWVEHGEKMRQAWEKAALQLENLTIKEGDHTKSLELSNLKLDDQIAKLEQRPDRNKLKEALLETGIAADELAARFSKDFEKMTDEINSSTTIMGRFAQSIDEVSHSKLFVGEVLGTLVTGGGLTAALGASAVGMTQLKDALGLVSDKLLEINKLRIEQANAKTEEQQLAAAHALSEAYGSLAKTTKDAYDVAQVDAPHNIKLITELSGTIISATAAQKDFGLQADKTSKEVTLAELQQAAAIAEAGDKAFKRQAEQWKQATDQEEKTRTDARNKAISDLQESEKEKLAATKQGSQARIDVIDAAIKEEQSKGLQDTQFYKSLLTQRVEAVRAATDAEHQVVNRAETEALKQAQDNAKLETATITEAYSEREKAVQQLVHFRLLSETQGSHQLELLYETEKQKILKILNDLLHQQQEAVKNAQSKLSAAKLNPFISPQQVTEAEKLLNQAEHDVANTQIKISKTTKEFQDKQITLDKGFYGKSLALAVASGNQLLAEKLKENHAALLSAQAQLAEAKARGVNTKAIEDEIKALQKIEKELGKEAHSSKDASGAMDQLKDSTKAAAMEMMGSFATAMEAMITGQQSFGQAMEAATFKMIGNLARSWAEYFAAKAIADIFWNPALGAAEGAAAIALFALSGLMSGLGSNVSNSGGGGGGDHPQIDSSNPNSQPAQNPQPGGRNVPHLAGGALITAPTLAMIGDSAGGGSAREGVIPLDDEHAMSEIAAAIADRIGNSGGNFYLQPKGMVSADTLSKLAKKLSRQVKTGRARLIASDSHKVTRRA